MKDAIDSAEESTETIQFGGVVMSPSVIDFEGVPMGSSATETLTLTNSNSTEAMVTTASIDSERFVVADSVALPITLDAEDSATIEVTYTPSRMDVQDGILSIGVAGQVGYAEIGLLGLGTDEEVPTPSDTGSETGSGAISANPASIDFGAIPAMSSTRETIEITNTGEADITITEVTSTYASVFSTDSDPIPPVTITAGSVLAIDVTFTPPSEAEYEAVIDVRTDTAGEDLQIEVSGKGNPPDCDVCAPRLEVMSSSGTSTSLDIAPAFGFGCTANGTITLENTGDMDLDVTAVNVNNDWLGLFGTFSATWTGPLVLAPGGVSVVAIDYIATTFAIESSDLATDQNVVHILSNDPTRPDWVIELSASVPFCG